MRNSLLTALGLVLAVALVVSCSDRQATSPADSPVLDALQECYTPPGGEGCTPGYWKVKPHADDWCATGYAKTDLYVDVFGVGPSMTLGAAVALKGNSFNSFMRHSVAALLNASHPAVAYDLDVAGVKSIVSTAFSSGDFTTAKNIFEGYNEQGCSID